MAGFELPIGIEIFRGRYVKSFAKPAPLKAGKVEHYQLGAAQRRSRVPAGPPDHGAGAVEPVPALRPQSADLRRQHLLREAGDYKKATQSVWFGGGTSSAIVLPVVP